jgi:hypothetical protein
MRHAQPPRRFSVDSRSLARIALTLVCVIVLVVVPSALAGKGKPGGGGGTTGGGGYTVTVNQPGPYYLGQQVSVTTNAPVYPDNAGPWIAMDCYQNGVKVGSDTHSGFPGAWYYGDPFTLGPSSMWSSGDADCVFTVFHLTNRKVVDATTTIHVDG